MYVTDLEDKGVSVAGDIPSGLPSLGISNLPSDVYSEIIGLAFGVFLLSYVEGIGVARLRRQVQGEDRRQSGALCQRRDQHRIGDRQRNAGRWQYVPLGSQLFGRRQDTPGRRVRGGLLGVVLLFLTGVFSELPEATLAAVVLVAVKGLIDIPALKRIFDLSKPEFLAAMLTLGGVLAIGMLEGILIGATFSLLSLAYRASKPQIDVLGQVPGADAFGSVTRHPNYAQVPGVLIMRVDGGVFYANADVVQEHILGLIEHRIGRSGS